MQAPKHSLFKAALGHARVVDHLAFEVDGGLHTTLPLAMMQSSLGSFPCPSPQKGQHNTWLLVRPSSSTTLHEPLHHLVYTTTTRHSLLPTCMHNSPSPTLHTLLLHVRRAQPATDLHGPKKVACTKRAVAGVSHTCRIDEKHRRKDTHHIHHKNGAAGQTLPRS